MKTENNEKFGVAFADFIITDNDDTETAYKVDEVGYMPSGISGLAIGGSTYYGETEQVDKSGQAGYAPDWVTEDYLVICGDNYRTIDAFISRISWLDDEDDDLYEVTNHELSGYYLGHRWLDGLDHLGRHYDDVLVVYTRRLETWDENNQPTYKVVGTPIEIQSMEIGWYQN